MKLPALLLVSLNVLLAGCVAGGLSLGVSPSPDVARPVVPASEPDWHGILVAVAAMNADTRRRELAALAALAEPTPAERFRLALLLERDDNTEALARAARLLASLDGASGQKAALPAVVRRLVQTRLDLRRQTERANALETKLDQIKALEHSLQQRSEPVKTP